MSEFASQYAAIEALQERVGIFIWSTESEDEAGNPAGPVREVDLGDTEASDETLILLQAFTGLEWLCLEETGITDSGLKSLARLKRLKRLELAGTRVTAAGVEQLRHELPGCEIEM